MHPRNPPSLVVALLAASLTLAGCLTLPGTDDAESASAPGPADGCTPTPLADPPDVDMGAYVEDGPPHDHGDPSLHTDAYRMERVGFTPMLENMAQGGQPGGYLDFEIAAGYAFVGNMGPHRGFSIVDVRTPGDPTHVADFVPNNDPDSGGVGGGSYWDIAAFDDGDLVVLAAQALAGSGVDSGLQEQQGGGLYLVDTSDKADPTLESFTRILDPNAIIPGGVHNVRAYTHDGEQIVVATTANGENQLYSVQGEPGSRTLQFESSVQGAHDSSFQVHPVTGDPLLYTANGGVLIYDVSDPAAPERVGFVPNGPELSAYHQVNPNNVLIDGRHLIVAATENSNGNPEPYTILDATDPSSPEILGQWELPADLEEPHGPYQFTSHNLDFDGGRLYAGHYHAGVWVIEASNMTAAQDPYAVAMYEPHQDPPAVPRSPLGRDSPSVWSANRYDGHVFAIDVNSGLYILETGLQDPSPCAEVHPTNIP